jgi:hypothetical protein
MNDRSQSRRRNCRKLRIKYMTGRARSKTKAQKKEKQGWKCWERKQG